jgi:hypothetical protein
VRKIFGESAKTFSQRACGILKTQASRPQSIKASGAMSALT